MACCYIGGVIRGVLHLKYRLYGYTSDLYTLDAVMNISET